MNYDYEILFEGEALEAVEMGLTDSKKVNEIIKEILNRRAKEGWQPLMPIIPPTVWFKKDV